MADSDALRSGSGERPYFDHAPDGIFVTDADGKYIDVNPAALTMTGYSREELLSMAVRDLAGTDGDEQILASFARLIESGAFQGDIRLRRKDGSTFPASLKAVALGGDRYMGFCADITERKNAEEEARELQKRDRAWLEHSPICTKVLDPDFNLQFMSAAGIRELQIDDVTEHYGKPYPFYFYPDGFKAQMGKSLERAKRTGQVVQQEGSVVDVNDNEHWYHSTVVPVHDGGQLQYMMIVSIEITDRKRAEREGESLQTQLNHAQKMESVGRLAGGVAHDFNNMLNVIMGHAELTLADLPEGSPLRAGLVEIQMAAKRSANLTRQLLAFARKQTVAPKVLDLSETIATMLMMLRRLIGEDISLRWRPDDSPTLVRIDPGQVDQLLANLAVNARDAIGHGVGKLTIETSNVAFDKDYCATHIGFLSGEYVMLAVSDDGCGMDEETRASIFEPFFTTKGVGEGTGLGLATVYGIVKQNRGFLNVYSEPGVGTTFRIYLPVYKAAPVRAAASEGAATPVVRGHERILVVEDEPATLSLTRTVLERLGYTVMTAGTPGEAIRLVRECTVKPDLLITDVVMPEMNGRDLAKDLLTLDPGLKRLFMSGYTANVIAHRGVLDEGVSFLQKPFSARELAEKVRNTLDQ